VSNFPFGFGPPSSGDDPAKRGEGSGDDPTGGQNPGQDPGQNPFAALFGAAGGPDLGAMFSELGRLLSWEGGPVNWDLARDTARQTASEGADPTPSRADRTAVAEALRLAQLWLDPVTTFPAGGSGGTAWSRAEWVEATLPVWRQLCDPVASRVADAMGTAVPAEMQAMAGPLLGVMRQVGGAMFGAQLGQAVGSLAREVVGSTDIGLSLVAPGEAALVPVNVAAFGEGLGVPLDQVRLYLALREAAHHRLFARVPWLRARLLAVVEEYAKGITVDAARMEEAVGSMDFADPEALQRAIGGGLFEPQTSPAQQATLARLETLLALVEGWVDEVVTAAAEPHLPAAGALRETVRRRRATGGPAEQAFATLVGLELRPRRLRDAAALWTALTAARGTEGRDAVWGHPDLLPTADDLDDPAAYAGRSAPLDLSALENTPPAPPEPPDPTENPAG
jgi:putative hydrolase